MSQENETSIEARKENHKKIILEHLTTTPIVEIACKKTGIGRSTFYRWKKEDDDFSQAVEESIASGSALISDMAESQLIKSIQNGNMTGIIFWLKSRHPSYTNKLEVTAKTKEDEALTPEQQMVVEKALELASLTKNNNQQYESNQQTRSDSNDDK